MLALEKSSFSLGQEALLAVQLHPWRQLNLMGQGLWSQQLCLAEAFQGLLTLEASLLSETHQSLLALLVGQGLISDGPGHQYLTKERTQQSMIGQEAQGVQGQRPLR